jgi:hypothetical protein
MMKQFAFITLVGLLALSTLACSVTTNAPSIRAQTGPTQTMTINENAPSDAPKLSIGMGAGKLNISGGSDALVSGEVRYNVAQLKPTIVRDSNSVTIKQEAEKFATLGTGVINDWSLKLGKMPMDLTINAGAYEGTVDLTGIALTNLEINDGASKAKVSFNEPNKQTMESLTYKTGASDVTLLGLGNANLKRMTFGGGAGAYTLDFSGKLQQDASVDVSSGVSSMKIIIPKGTHAVVKTTGALSNVDQQGSWSVTDHTYETTGEGPLLTINVEMGVGSLQLVNQ